MSNIFPTFVGRLGNNIYYRLCDEKGNRKTLKERFKPYLFVGVDDSTPIEVADAIALCSPKGAKHTQPLSKMEFDNIYEFSQYIRDNIDIPNYYMYGQENVVFQAIARLYQTIEKGGKTGEPSIDHIVAFDVDIEVNTSFLNDDGVIVTGPFPKPVIEYDNNGVLMDKRFDVESYAVVIDKFYNWFHKQYPKSFIPTFADRNYNAAYPIQLIQLHNMQEDKCIVWGIPSPGFEGKFKYDTNDKIIGGLNFEYREFDAEQELLSDFIRYWAKISPDAWTGWNIEGFDAPYIAERVLKILGTEWLNALSPVGSCRTRLVKPDKGIPYTTWNFEGVSKIDYLPLYKKHRLKERANYRLGYIAQLEIGEGKVEYSEFLDLGGMYFNDYIQFVRYGTKDIMLVKKMDDKLGYLALTYELAYELRCNYEDTLSTVAPWSAKTYSFLMSQNPPRAPQIKKVKPNDTAYAGAFVHTPTPGRYRYVISEDLNSLYPHILMGTGCAGETIVDAEEREDILFELADEIEAEYNPTDGKLKQLKKNLLCAIRDRREIIDYLVELGPYDFKTLKRHGVGMTPDLQFYYNDIPSSYASMMFDLYSKRKGDKKIMLCHEQTEDKYQNLMDQLMVGWVDESSEIEGFNKAKLSQLIHDAVYGKTRYDTKQMGKKIAMNSFYGAIANRYFKEYFDPRIARSITASGELVNKFITKRINEYLKSVCKNTDGYRYVIYGDTDSVISSTLINVNGEEITIGDFYDKTPEVYERHDEVNENYIKYVPSGTLSPSVSPDFEIQENQIKYVMKHKVKKRMFKITVDGKEVIVTEDHSCMVKRDGILTRIKAKDIKHTDVLLTLEK